MPHNKKAALVLSDGSIYFGSGLGAPVIKSGELVFNTSMTGYQEALTDPSYAGQILLMTYPLIGNYGLNDKWTESSSVWVEGFCVRQDTHSPRHVHSKYNLDKYLENNGAPGISGIDTRSIVRKLRNFGVMPAALCVYEKEPDMQELLSIAKKTDYSNLDFVQKVSIDGVKTFGNGSKTVALLDMGVKGNIIRELVARNCTVKVFPAFSTADEILSHSPSGIFLSNGPGDPARLSSIVSEVKKLVDLPIMGICLGHQIMGWVAGSKTYKLKFGHRGSNHPVMDKNTSKVVITTQNHGFAVDEKHLPKEWRATHTNLNDGTNEGMEHESLPIFSVQYHPEAHPGPHDSMYLFDKFVKNL